MKKLFFLLLSLLITTLSFGQPTLNINDGPPNGSTATISPEGVNATVDFETTNFAMSNASDICVSDNSGDGYIVWDIVDTGTNSPVDSGCIFTSNDGFEYEIDGLMVGKTYLLTAELVDNTGTSLNPAVTYTLTVTIATYMEVDNLEDLRGSSYDDDTYFKVTGPVTNTYSRPGDFNEQYFQDETGGIPTGIMVYDEDDYIATYNEGDVVSNIKGQLSELNGVLTLFPTEAGWEAASSNSPITPEIVTTTQIIAALDNYESELVEIKNATFVFPGGNFTAGQTHPINDGGAENFPFRCNFPEADYITNVTEIPSTPQDIVGIVIEFNTFPRITARSLTDITLDSNEFNIESFKLYPNPTALGYINISSRNGETIKATVFDILGKQVINSTVINNRLDVSNLNAGVYIMRLTQNNATVTKKLIIN